mgnify:CR=1 FL=1
MTEDDDVPTVDEDEFELPDDPVFGDPGELRVNGESVGKISDFDVSVGDFEGKASQALTDTFDTVADALSSAMWHSIIDDAGHEAFVDDFELAHFRDAEHELRSNGYAGDGLTITDLYGDTDDQPEGAAFFVGAAVADMIRDYGDSMVRINDHDGEVDATGDDLPGIDGYLVEEASGLPANLAVFLDVDAIARVPSHGRAVGPHDTPTVSSPVVVKDPGGVAVVNIAEQ